MGIRTNPVVKRFVEVGEAQVSRMTNQLLANEKFLLAVQQVVSRTLSAKGNLDRSLRSALATMNLPSTADVEGLKAKLDDLDRTMTDLDAKLARLEERMVAGGGSAPAKKKASSGASAPRKAAPTRAPAAKKGPSSAAKKGKESESR